MDDTQKYKKIVLDEIMTEQLAQDDSDLSQLIYVESLTYLLDQLPPDEGKSFLELLGGDNEDAFASKFESLTKQHQDGLEKHLEAVMSSLAQNE